MPIKTAVIDDNLLNVTAKILALIASLIITELHQTSVKHWPAPTTIISPSSNMWAHGYNKPYTMSPRLLSPSESLRWQQAMLSETDYYKPFSVKANTTCYNGP